VAGFFLAAKDARMNKPDEQQGTGCPPRCSGCTFSRDDRQLAPCPGNRLEGWRLALAAGVAFVLPCALAGATVIACGFVQGPAGNEYVKTISAIVAMILGVALAAGLVRHIGKDRRKETA